MSLVDADDQHWRAATLRGIDEAFALMGMIVDIYHGPATTGGE
jgi:hypothetical protein